MTEYFKRNVAASFNRLLNRAADSVIYFNVFGPCVRASEDVWPIQVAALCEGVDVGCFHDYNLDLMEHDKRKGRRSEAVPPFRVVGTETGGLRRAFYAA